jgi:hypothetical protein
MEDVCNASNAFHANERSNYIGLAVNDMVFETVNERNITHRISSADFSKIKNCTYTNYKWHFANENYY